MTTNTTYEFDSKEMNGNDVLIAKRIVMKVSCNGLSCGFKHYGDIWYTKFEDIEDYIGSIKSFDDFSLLIQNKYMEGESLTDDENKFVNKLYNLIKKNSFKHEKL